MRIAEGKGLRLLVAVATGSQRVATGARFARPLPHPLGREYSSRCCELSPPAGERAAAGARHQGDLATIAARGALALMGKAAATFGNSRDERRLCRDHADRPRG